MTGTIDAARLKQKATKWFEAEVNRAKQAHRSRWPEHESWVMDYLAVELRQRIARFVKVRNA